MKDAVVIKWTSIIHLSGRFLTISAICILYQLGGFFDNDFLILIKVLSPLSIFYLTAFVRYAVKYPYPYALEKARRTDLVSLPLFVVAYLIDLVVLILSALNPNLIDFETATAIVWGGEVFFAIITAITLPNIIHRFPLN